MAKKRVHEIAKEKGIPSKEVIAVLQKAGLNVKAAASSVDEADIARAFSDGSALPVEPATPKTEAPRRPGTTPRPPSSAPSPPQPAGDGNAAAQPDEAAAQGGTRRPTRGARGGEAEGAAAEAAGAAW